MSNTLRLMNIFRPANNLLPQLICTETLLIICCQQTRLYISGNICLLMSFKVYFEATASRSVHSIEFMSHV